MYQDCHHAAAAAAAAAASAAAAAAAAIIIDHDELWSRGLVRQQLYINSLPLTRY